MTQIKGFLESSFVDWPGKLCAVVFFSHCTFRCPYCHNHVLVLDPERYLSIPLEDILDRLRAFKGWIDGVCLSGGEPTLYECLPLVIRRIKAEGFLVKLDTNGSNPDLLEGLIERREVDFVSMDVKAPLDPFSYRRAAGCSVDLNRIVRSIRILKEGGVDHQFRTTVVPALHGKEDIRKIGEQLRAGRNFVLQILTPKIPSTALSGTVWPTIPKR